MAKKKERKLTAQEAIAYAKSDLAPLWLHSEPLFASIKNKGQSVIYPLDESFRQKAWLLIFIDIVAISTEFVFTMLREFNRRYQPHGLNPVVIFSSPFKFMFKQQEAEYLMAQLGFKCPVHLDKDGATSTSLKVVRSPSFLILDQGETSLNEGRLGAYQALEIHIQNTLRKKDPGISMLKYFQMETRNVVDLSPINFGWSQGVEFPKPGFKKNDKGAWEANFKPTPELASMPFVIEGKWEHDQDHITALSKDASITLDVTGTDISLIIRPIDNEVDLVPRVDVSIDGREVFSKNRGKNLIIDDEGKSYFKVDRHRVFHIITELTQPVRLKLQFTTSEIKQVKVYGLRLSTLKSSLLEDK